MAEAPVYKNAYTNTETNYNKSQATVTIEGQSGKQVSIDELTLKLWIYASGYTATACVIATCNGVTKTIAEWTSTNTLAEAKAESSAYLGDEGKDVTLDWYIKSSKDGIKALMKYLTYDVSYVDVIEEEPTTEEETDYSNLVVVVGTSKEDAETIKAKLGSYIIDREIFVMKKA